MKKILLGAIGCILIFTGCGSSKVTSPNMFTYNNKVYTYENYDDSIDNVVTDGLKNVPSKFINITNPNVETYKNIKVGDNISKVLDEFKYEQNGETVVFVLFDGKKEIDSANANDEDLKNTDIWLAYHVEDSKIEKIRIYDQEYWSGATTE